MAGRIIPVPSDEISDLDGSDVGAVPLEWPGKDPDEVLDFGLDWNARCAVNSPIDQVALSEWFYDFVDANNDNTLNLFLESFSYGVTRVWLEKGQVGRTYKITNRVTTTADRVMEQTVSITIRER